MAKGKKKSKKGERQMPSDLDNGSDASAEVGGLETARIAAPRRAARATRVGGLSIYKPGQGYYTRVGTAIGAGILTAGMWNMLFNELEYYVDNDVPWTFYLQIGVPTLVAAVLGFLVYWIVGKNRRTCDFMILTEGEMKKVSWSSRKEVIGSTKVVIFTVVAMATLLFVVDLVFAIFFHWIGVLKVAPSVFGQASGAG